MAKAVETETFFSAQEREGGCERVETGAMAGERVETYCRDGSRCSGWQSWSLMSAEGSGSRKGYMVDEDRRITRCP